MNSSSLYRPIHEPLEAKEEATSNAVTLKKRTFSDELNNLKWHAVNWLMVYGLDAITVGL